MNKIKVGIIGAGNISKSHIQAITGQDGFELVGIADISEPARTKAAQAHGVPTYADHKALMEAARPDYVVVCSPHYSHGPITLDALAMGVHVFVEKPMAVEASVAEQFIALASERNLRLGVNFVRRQIPNQRKMAELVHAGFIGELIHATMICAKRYRTMAYYKSGGWRATWAGEGGGVLVNQAPHDLDFLLWVLGAPTQVVADMEALCHTIEVEDDATAIFKFPNGANCTFYASTNVVPGRESFEVIGTKGRLILENDRLTATSLKVDQDAPADSRTPRVDQEQVFELPDEDVKLLKMHKSFVRAIRTGEPPTCPAEDGLKEVQLANAMLVSAIRREWVKLPPDKTEYRALLDKLLETKSMTATREWAAG